MTKQPYAIGIEYLTFAEELTPPRFVEAVAAGGARTVCLGSRKSWGLHDSSLRRETRGRLKDLGIGVTMADGFLLGPQWGGREELQRQMDVALDVGAPLVNACAFDPDPRHARDPDSIKDALADLCVMARDRGVSVLLEFMLLSHVPSITAAAALVRELDQPNLTILLDTLHLERAGEGPAELSSVDPAMIGYCQLCDGARGMKPFEEYLDEALHERALPGEGALPLTEILRLIPRDTVISTETPLRRLRQAGINPIERTRRIVAASRAVVAQAWSDDDP